MSQSTPPDRRSSLIAGFVLNTLDESEAEEFDQLIASDAALLEEVAQLQETVEQSYSLEDIAPPLELRDRLLTSFSNQWSNQPAQVVSEADPAQLQPPSHRRRNQFKLATALLAIALAISNYVWWQSSRPQIAQQIDPTDSVGGAFPGGNRPNQTKTYNLDNTEAGTGGTVAVEINPDQRIATLTASDLPPIGSDQVYVLWTVLAPNAPYTADSKSAILTTTFTPDAQGDSQKGIALPAAFEQPGAVAALGVTIESAAAPQNHQGVPVLLALL